MPVRRTSYPQVDPRAAGLMHRRLVVVPPGLAVSPAARLADRQRARLVVARIGAAWAAASRDTLGRALALGLGRVAGLGHPLGRPRSRPRPHPRSRSGIASDRTSPSSWSEDPEAPRASSSASPARRSGCPCPSPASSTGCRGRAGEILRAAGAHGDTLGLPVAAVGGLVRDLLLGRVDERTDLDLVVEGSAATLARALAQESRRTDPGAPGLPHGDGPPPRRTPGRTSRPRAANPTARRAPCPTSSPPRSRRISRAATSP